MPELPDVEIYSDYIKATALHKKITAVKINNDKILKHLSAQTFEKRLKGRSFEALKRHGKHLFIQLDNNEWLRLHFGMTGDIKYYKDQAKESQYSRIVFSFGNDYQLALLSQRLFGSVSLGKDLQCIEKDLGPDALEIGKKPFSDLIRQGRGTLKYTLMNQNKIAGIGNIYSDEILFQSKLHPKTKAGNLEGKEINTLYKTMKRVLKKAIGVQADLEKFPRSWIIPSRKEGVACPRCGEKIVKTKVSGRSAYFCPSCQKKE